MDMKEPKMVKISPCPKCGSWELEFLKDVPIIRKRSIGNGYAVACKDCNYMGEARRFFLLAKKSWNKEKRN